MDRYKFQIISVTAVVIALAALAMTYEYLDITTEGNEPAGSFQHASYQRPSIGADTTAVETDRGMYVVYGTFTSAKGTPLTIAIAKSGARYLCKKTNDCMRMADQ